MVNLANINLGKDLAKLPLAERLNIMMHYRAAEFLQKPTPISKLEYETLDACIRTNEDIRAYNRRNNDYMSLSMQFDYIVKCVVGVELRANYFKMIWLANRQTAYMIDTLNEFVFMLNEELEDTKNSKTSYEDLILGCLKKSIAPFNRFEIETDSENCRWLVTKLKKGDSYQQKVDELNTAFAKLEPEIAEYHELEQNTKLQLTPFSNTFPHFIAEAKGHMEWLERLNCDI